MKLSGINKRMLSVGHRIQISNPPYKLYTAEAKPKREEENCSTLTHIGSKGEEEEYFNTFLILN